MASAATEQAGSIAVMLVEVAHSILAIESDAICEFLDPSDSEVAPRSLAEALGLGTPPPSGRVASIQTGAGPLAFDIGGTFHMLRVARSDLKPLPLLFKDVPALAVTSLFLHEGRVALLLAHERLVGVSSVGNLEGIQA